MMRFIMPAILIGISITMFFVFTNPMYKDISTYRSEITTYNEALDNSKALENERDKLTAKFNAMDPDNIIKLQKLLPNNVDNIRLILEIEQIALPYGMALKDIKYSVTEPSKTDQSVGVVQGGGIIKSVNQDYGVWDLEFSVTGTYNNFLNFTRDLESNLRIVDVSSIQFSSDVNTNTSSQTSGSKSSSNSSSSTPESYKYNFKIKTYWLKN